MTGKERRFIPVRSLLPALALLASAAVLVARAQTPPQTEMVILEEEEPQSPYPFLARSMSEQRLAELLFDRLYVRSESGYLATQVFQGEGTARPPRLQMEVREDLRFANGDPTTFADVAFSMNDVYRSCAVAPDACGWFGLVFGDARQITDRIGEVVFSVSMPDEEPEQYLRTTALYSRKALDPAGKGEPDVYASRRDPVGTGPFWAEQTIDSFDDIHLRRNPHRKAERDGVVSALRLLYDQDSARQKELMLGRKADVWVSPPPAVLPEFANQTETFSVVPYELNQWWYVAVDTSDTVLSDARIRQALDLLVPRDQLMEKFGGTSAAAISGPFMPGSAWCAPDTQPTREDAAAAARLLEQAGYRKEAGMWSRDGQHLALTLGVQSDIVDDYYDVVYGLSDAWDNAGMRIKVRTIRPSDWRDLVETGRGPEQFDLILGRWNVDREAGALDLFVEDRDGGRTVNLMGYNDAQVEETVQAFYRESSGPEREAIMRSLHQRLHDDRPYLFLWSLRVNSVVRRDLLKGVRPATFYYYTTIDDWRWRDPQ